METERTHMTAYGDYQRALWCPECGRRGTPELLRWSGTWAHLRCPVCGHLWHNIQRTAAQRKRAREQANERRERK